ncbi:hypothetical protein DCO46_21070 [Flavobacterium sp. HTF]|nr:hypothetical protein DCO46_21070 [Flavobacterium sp. HTF]
MGFLAFERFFCGCFMDLNACSFLIYPENSCPKPRSSDPQASETGGNPFVWSSKQKIGADSGKQILI